MRLFFGMIMLLMFTGCASKSVMLYRVYNDTPKPLANVARVIAYVDLKAIINKEGKGNPLLNNGDYWMFAPGSEDTKAGQQIETYYATNKTRGAVVELLPGKEYKFWFGNDKYRTLRPKAGEVYMYKPTKYSNRYYYDQHGVQQISIAAVGTNLELVKAKSYQDAMDKNYSTKHSYAYYFDGKYWVRDDRSTVYTDKYSSGQLNQRFTVENGMSKKYESWWPNGNKKAVYYLKNGLLDGSLKSWDQNGNPDN